MAAAKYKVGILMDFATLSGREAAQSKLQTHGVEGTAPRQSATLRKKERDDAALKMWHQWAQQTIGPITSEPTAEEFAAKGRSIKKLERDCAELVAQAQRRLELSASLQYGSLGTSSLASGAAQFQQQWSTGAKTGGGGGGGKGSAFTREFAWASREKRRNTAYQVFTASGVAEREASSANSSQRPPSAPTLRSRSMLETLLSDSSSVIHEHADVAAGQPSGRYSDGRRQYGSSGNTAAERPASASVLRQRPPSPLASSLAATGALQRPHSAVAAPTAGGTIRQRPQSAFSSSSTMPHQQRPWSAASAGAEGGGARRAWSGRQAGSSGRPQSPQRQQSAMSPAAAAALASAMAGPTSSADVRAETEALHQQLDAAKGQLDAQSEVEAQLRETVDLLRARLHSQTLREVDSQRRLAQHSRLEPLFDRLAEVFTFKSPDEVVERLEFLEDDKLGTIDQMIRAQEEVATLQQRLNATVKAADVARTTAATEHIQAGARLQAQNEALQLELDLQEGLVRRLEDRQGQLTKLQSAVLDLWSRCQMDPNFIRANQRDVVPQDGDGTAAGGGTATADMVQMDADGSPMSILMSIREYVIARSPELSNRHYLDLQRVANRVWQHHFKHKEDIRGCVVETFQQLSALADILAHSVKSGKDQIERSKENERNLAAQVKRLSVQKRALEAQLERREQNLRDLAGVPRAERAPLIAEVLVHSPGLFADKRATSPLIYNRPLQATSISSCPPTEQIRPSRHSTAGSHSAASVTSPTAPPAAGGQEGSDPDDSAASREPCPHSAHSSELRRSGSSGSGGGGGAEVVGGTTAAAWPGGGSGPASTLMANGMVGGVTYAGVLSTSQPSPSRARPQSAMALPYRVGALYQSNNEGVSGAPPAAAAPSALATSASWAPRDKFKASFLRRLQREA